MTRKWSKRKKVEDKEEEEIIYVKVRAMNAQKNH